jgi:glycosyltransferase involved in cell wall biosynthesis
MASNDSTMSGPITYVLIPVYNRQATTIQCLNALQKNGDLQHYRVVVIDDGSTDGTSVAIQKTFPTVTILTGNGDLWWTGAMRLGMDYAYQNGADIVIWLNDDCLPLPGTLDTLVQVLQTQIEGQQAGGIAAAACTLTPSNQLLETGFRQRQRYTAHPGELIAVEGVTGYCVALSRTVLDRIGLPDAARFPHYCGDDMYTLKASRAGFPVCIVGDALAQIRDMQEANHDFTSYVRVRLGQDVQARSLFFSKKSRYYLPAQFFYHLEKYGSLGIGLFSLKIIQWALHYAGIRLTRPSNTSPPQR